MAKRAIFLAITLVIAIYITVVIANGGGLIDNILKAQIKNDLTQSLHPADKPGPAIKTDCRPFTHPTPPLDPTLPHR